MKKVTILFAALMLCTIICKAQTPDTLSGWYIVEAGTMWAEDKTLKDCEDIFAKDYVLNAGEVVFVTGKNGAKYLALDPAGRNLVLVGNITKVPAGYGLGILTKTFTLLTGVEIKEGSVVWLTGQDLGKQTVKFASAGNQQYEVPQDNVILLSVYLTKNSEKLKFKVAL